MVVQSLTPGSFPQRPPLPTPQPCCCEKLSPGLALTLAQVIGEKLDEEPWQRKVGKVISLDLCFL